MLAELALGSSRASAARIARSAQDSLGLNRVDAIDWAWTGLP
jgi:hypothetical protein